MHGAELPLVLRRLALEAGEAILAIYRGGELGERRKADESPVTAADLAADRVLCDGLAAAFPDAPVVTEERAATHGAAGAGRHFLVDPLDGTKEFVQRRDEFTVNVALVEDGRPVAGVVYAPAIGRLFLAAGGEASEERAPFGPEPGATRPLRVAAPDPAAVRVVASKSHRDPQTEAYIARYPVSEVKSAGSSLKFCLLAAGEADLYPRFGPTMEWDTAAGHAVLLAAGGRVVELDGVTPLAYGKAGRRNPGFIAASEGLPLAGAADPR